VTPLDVSAAAFLFDMDGTLVDSTALVERTWSRFSAEHGLDPDEVIAFAHGRRTADTVLRFVGERPDVEEIALALERADDEQDDGVVEVAGAAVLLERLVAEGAPVAVVTSATHDLARARLAGAGLVVPRVLVGADDVAAGKPAPDGYLAAAAALGVEPADCVAFEDTEAGLEAVLASGATAVVVGDLASARATDLPRLADWSEVVVARVGDRVRLRSSAPGTH
jgi:sugar-phosphatase